MAARGRRRKPSAPLSIAPVATEVAEQEVAPNPDDGDGTSEPETDNLQPSADEGEDMADEDIKAESKPESGKQVLFALSRCRYSSNGKITDAEAGDEITNPHPKDLEDLIEHGCVETFDQSQIGALLSLKSKDAEAKKRLARAIGIL